MRVVRGFLNCCEGINEGHYLVKKMMINRLVRVSMIRVYAARVVDNMTLIPS